ncbi:related to YOS1, subunit of the Yip1p-Yif1p Complex, required for Transport between the ER and th [Fusarium torulosum]|uniref:Related to YOS1, subunit of the Yip1p-Yif1p Complex, required for Transport between the ER and th n=1 Tax=Fusarium torulosum TaxID=33205 RepID=A0AAE8MFW0_9HYPO|nr:related to YOS1, subunit of the Yip1p-Yif1p Complex, required for Transport between the ER and th [Fusarium torulosum]
MAAVERTALEIVTHHRQLSTAELPPSPLIAFPTSSAVAQNVVLWKFSLCLYPPNQRRRCPFRRSFPRAQYEQPPPMFESKYICALYLTAEPPVNLSPASYDPAFGAGPDASVKAKIINLIASVRTIMRMPLIFVNSVIILYELILG